MKINTNLIKRTLASVIGNLATPIWVAALVLPLSYTALGFYDTWRHIGDTPEISSKEDYERAINKLKTTLEQSSVQQSVSTEIDNYQTSIFTTRTVRITAYRPKAPKDQFTLNTTEITVENSYRFESAGFIFAAGAWLLALYLLNWAVKAIKELTTIWSEQRDESVQQIISPESSPPTLVELHDNSKDDPPTATKALLQDVAYSRQSATKAQLQAAILVVSGVSMALLGVVVFFFSLPTISELRSLEADERIQVSLIASIRPAATLFFIEAVAWFLLRQYRLVSIDFKEYLDRAAARTDALASVQLAESWGDPDIKRSVLTSLLSKSAIETLRDGETTVSLENEKIGAANPIWQLTESLVKKIPDASQK